MPEKPNVVVRVLTGRTEVENSADARLHLVVKIMGPAIDPADRGLMKLVVALDVSSSMNEAAGEGGGHSKLSLAKRVFHRLLPFLRDDDVLGLVVFSDRARVELEPAAMTGQAKRTFGDRVEAARIEGNTNISEALQIACERARRLRARPDEPVYVLFLTDGNPTAGITDNRTLVRLLENEWAEGVRLLCAGIGHDYNPALLDAFAKQSAGHFVHIQGEGQFAEAMGDLLGAAASVQHVNLSVAVTPEPWISIAEVFTSESVHTESDGTMIIKLGDVFAESTRAVGFELRLEPRDTIFPRPTKICRVVVTGTDARSGKMWMEETEVKVQLVEPGKATASYNAEAYSALVGIVAKAAAEQAMAHAEQGNFGVAVGRIDQAIAFVKGCERFCDVRAALEQLRQTRDIVANPENFYRGHHVGRSTTAWMGGRGTQAPAGPTPLQRTITQVVQIGDGGSSPGKP